MTAFATQAWAAGLIVVEIWAAPSALPYYQGLDPAIRCRHRTWRRPGRPWLRCVSSSLPPVFRQDRSGARHQRPGLQPLFLVGDDTLSQTWLKRARRRPPRPPSRGPGSERGRRSAPDRRSGLGERTSSGYCRRRRSGDLVDRLRLQHYPRPITYHPPPSSSRSPHDYSSDHPWSSSSRATLRHAALVPGLLGPDLCATAVR
ncbi:DUF2859 domain-containing protein [Pseudomonas aeruginosa]